MRSGAFTERVGCGTPGAKEWDMALHGLNITTDKGNTCRETHP